MKKPISILGLLICLMLGFLIGRLTNICANQTENSQSINTAISFDDTFSGLDDTNSLFSNVEKGKIRDAKSDMISARNLYMINRIILNSNEIDRPKWRDEKSAWDCLSNDIEQFLSAKMTEQWETGKTGTAGSSYCSSCRYALEATRAIILESLIHDTEFIIEDDYDLLYRTSISKRIPLDYTVSDLSNEISRYLDGYISGEFLEWHNEDTSLTQWRSSTSELITSLKNNLNEYAETSITPFDSACPIHGDIRLKWILQQISQIIKIGDLAL